MTFSPRNGLVLPLLFSVFLSGYANGSESSTRLWRILNGTHLQSSDPINQQIEDLIAVGKLREAAALTTKSSRSTFLVNRVRQTFAPLASRDVDPLTPIGDFTLTIMKAVQLDRPLNELFMGGMRFGMKSQSIDDRDNAQKSTAAIHAQLKSFLTDEAFIGSDAFVDVGQPALYPESRLGVLTSAQYGVAIFEGGTNRRAVRKIVEDWLCVGTIDRIKNYNIPDLWVGRDVERTPGGHFQNYANGCVGCHAGMDAVRGAFARYDILNLSVTDRYPGGTVATTDPEYDAVQMKMNINSQNFPSGYHVTDSRWEHNGWMPIRPDLVGSVYRRPSDISALILSSPELYSCLTKRVQASLCPDRQDITQEIDRVASRFQSHKSLRTVFLDAAVEICL